MTKISIASRLLNKPVDYCKRSYCCLPTRNPPEVSKGAFNSITTMYNFDQQTRPQIDSQHLTKFAATRDFQLSGFLAIAI